MLPDEHARMNSINFVNTGSNGIVSFTPRNIQSFRLKLFTKCIYIGKVKNTVSYVEINSDRLIFANLSNRFMSNKFNITVPYNEVTAIRYCFCDGFSALFIQPIFESFVKINKWLQDFTKSHNSPNVPENFIMVHLENELTTDQIIKMSECARECQPDVKLIEINLAFALDYLNKPYKADKRMKMETKEVIHLDDDSDDEKTESDENIVKKNEKSLLDEVILRYPENESKPIILYGRDLNCLRDGQYLNDNIMNFYLKYYQYSGKIAQEIVEKIHIYDALFAAHLINVNTRKRKFTFNKNNLIVRSFESLENAYHSLLKTWTKDIDIFAKDFLLIPLVIDSHWFLIIVCYIGNIIKDDSGVVPNRTQSIKKPTIIFMDSLNINVNRNEIYKSILTYLNLELQEKRGRKVGQEVFHLIKSIHAKVPQQKNFYDCGLFVLEYIERFLKNPEDNFLTIANSNSGLQSWFDPGTLCTKRATIQQIILNLLPPDNAKKLEKELTKVNLDNFANQKLEIEENGEKNESTLKGLQTPDN